jgi:hypothetical protein
MEAPVLARLAVVNPCVQGYPESPVVDSLDAKKISMRLMKNGPELFVYDILHFLTLSSDSNEMRPQQVPWLIARRARRGFASITRSFVHL